MSRKEQLKNLFMFTKGEQHGIIVLVIILLLLSFITFTIKYFVHIDKHDFTNFEKEISEFEASLTTKKQISHQSRLDKYIIKRYDTLSLFEFNPNTIKAEQWKKLGLSDKQIKTVTNYISKGGKFYDKDDFRKIYGIRHKQFEILKPYIKLPEYSNYLQQFYKKKYEEYSETDDFIPDSLFHFNPNLVNKKELSALGFSDKQISVIQNYRNNGGKFYKKIDLKKIYGIKEKQYEAVKEYIIFDNNKNNEITEVDKINIQVDINTLNESDFIALGGFWKYNAKRIVKYRELLGGYHKKEQLLEIYGMKEKYYNKISDNIIIDKIKIKKIRINFAEKKELAKHPYIKWINAEDIIDSKSKKGPFKNIEELRKRKVISRTMFKKIKPYITIN